MLKINPISRYGNPHDLHASLMQPKFLTERKKMKRVKPSTINSHVNVTIYRNNMFVIIYFVFCILSLFCSVYSAEDLGKLNKTEERLKHYQTKDMTPNMICTNNIVQQFLLFCQINNII